MLQRSRTSCSRASGWRPQQWCNYPVPPPRRSRGGPRTSGGWPRGCAGLPPFPQGPLEKGLEHQPAGAGERGDQAPHKGCGDLPQRRRQWPPADCVYTRLVGAVLLEQHEHLQLEGRRMFSADSMAAIPELDDIPALQALSA